MKIEQFMAMPLSEGLKELTMTKCITHTDANGNLASIELKYEDPAVSNTKPDTDGGWGDANESST